MVRKLALLSPVVLTCALACGPGQSAITVKLTNAVLATTGGNLFNCASPGQPATPRAVSQVVGCTPKRNPDGSLSTTPTEVVRMVGCGDGHGAQIVVTCAGTGSGKIAKGTVTLTLTSSCDQTAPGSGQTMTFDALAPGTSQTASLTDCATFQSFCPSSDACAFNKFHADIEVMNTAAD